MTYGEYNYHVKNNIKLRNGVWVADKPSGNIPTRMSREAAAVYYTLKFRKYWQRNY